MKPFVGMSGWHRGPGLGCYESDDRRAVVEKMLRKKQWKLWVYEGWLRRSSKHVGTYPSRKAAMLAYRPNSVISRSSYDSDHGNERGMEYGQENQGFVAAAGAGAAGDVAGGGGNGGDSGHSE